MASVEKQTISPCSMVELDHDRPKECTTPVHHVTKPHSPQCTSFFLFTATTTTAPFLVVVVMVSYFALVVGRVSSVGQSVGRSVGRRRARACRVARGKGGRKIDRAGGGTRRGRAPLARSLSSSPSSSAFDQGLLTVSGNSVQLTNTSEFANDDDDDGREDGGRWPLWLSPPPSRRPPPPPIVFTRDDDLILSQFLLCPMLCLHMKTGDCYQRLRHRTGGDGSGKPKAWEVALGLA